MFDVDGKMKGKTGDIRWDFFFSSEDLIPINGGGDKVMAVKMWRKEAFDNLVAYIKSTPDLHYISIENR